VAGMMVAGFVTKTVFCAVLSMESVVLNLSNERQANEARRQLLRYVFHEVRSCACACAPLHHVITPCPPLPPPTAPHFPITDPCLFAGQVRVPLNTLTMGLTILKDDEYTRLTDAGRDVIDMMDGAAVRGPHI
jgi:hypothetical protein